MSDQPPPPNPWQRVPSITEVAPWIPPERPPKPPRKWWGRKGGLIIVAAVLVIWLYLVITDHIIGGGPGDIPTAVLLGGFGVAVAFLYTMAYRLRQEDGVTVVRLIIAFAAGGLLSTQVAGGLNALIDHFTRGIISPLTPQVVVRSTAGLVEELCKILAVVLVSKGLPVKNARVGLFMGGAVGFGFSAFEDMDYGVAAAHSTLFANSHFVSYLGTAIGRSVLGPFAHPIFTALLAAALFAAVRNGRYRITLGVVGTYLLVALVHGLVDSSGDYLGLLLHSHAAGSALGGLVTLLLALGSGTVWLVVSRRIRARTLAEGLVPPQLAVAQTAP